MYLTIKGVVKYKPNTGRDVSFWDQIDYNQQDGRRKTQICASVWTGSGRRVGVRLSSMRCLSKKIAVFALILATLAPVLAGCVNANALPEMTATAESAASPTGIAPAKTAIAPTPAITSTPMAAPTPRPEEERKATLEARLAETSQGFIALTPEAANEVAREIGFIDGINESASNACGPLSIAILKAADLLPESASVHDVWLLNLRLDYSLTNVLYEEYFPPQDYDYVWVEQSIRDYDFAANPLKPGDWLFLFTAGNGFDHMLTVTRVDENGAAYSVTNIDRGEDFIIAEEMLYDPNQEGEGLFYELTDPEKRLRLGLTGTKRWLLVRRKGGLASLPALNSELKLGLADEVDWHGLVTDLATGEVLFDSLPNDPFHPASMIKVPIAVLGLQILEDMGYNVSDLAINGYAGRTFDQLFSAMIVASEELAAEELRQFVRANVNEGPALQDLGLNDTQLFPRSATAYDLGRVLQGIYSKEYLSDEFNRYLLDLMHVQTENDKEYLGVIPEVYPQVVFYNKRGSLLDPTIVSDMGILTVDEKAYAVVISGTPKTDGSARFEDIQIAVEEFALQLMPLLIENDPH